MESIDSIELLSKRLLELHELLFAFIGTLMDLAESGLLEKSLARRELQYDSPDGDFRALIRALRYLGEKLAWLDQAHTEDGKPRQNINRSDFSRYDSLMAQISDLPTGNRLCDTVMELKNTMIQRDWMLFKLGEDCAKGRFHNESDYPSEDITRVLARLAMDQMILFDLFCRLMFAVCLESEPDTGDDDFRALRNRHNIQERNMQWLTRFLKVRRRAMNTGGSKKKRRPRQRTLFNGMS